jgi:pimeloyl-ACP methyl ester carboxylesterase
MARFTSSSVGRFRYLDIMPAAPTRSLGTVVLVHAFPLNARMWEAQLPLGERWRIVAPQLRGFDGGTRDPSATSMDDYAADVIDLLDALHVHEAVIGGLSLGGYVTFAVFRRAPQYFRGMVLADTRAEADTPEGLEGRKRMLALVKDEGPAAVADNMMPKLLSEDALRNRQHIVDQVRSLMLASPAEAITGAVTAMMTRRDSTHLLGSISCPTLVVVGEEDKITPPAISRDLHRAIPRSELSTIPGAGHLSNIEQPDAFNRAVGGFLGRHC